VKVSNERVDDWENEEKGRIQGEWKNKKELTRMDKDDWQKFSEPEFVR
jgi:hypothetical protein